MTALTKAGPATPPEAPSPPSLLTRAGRELRRAPYLLLLPGIAWLVFFFLVPLYFQAKMSVSSGSLEQGFGVTWSWDTFSEAFKAYDEHFLRSVYYAGAATVLCLVLAYPLAYTIAFRAGRWRNLLLVLVIAPFFTSFLVRTLAWKTILSDNGTVVGFLNWAHVTDATATLGLTEGDRVLATPLAVVTGLTYNFLPFMILPLYASLDRIDPRLHEAARDLYASPAATFRRVTLPLSMPGVVGGTLLTFIPASGDYINAQLLGTTRETMIGNVIQSEYLRVRDYPTAAALSFVLMAVILVIVTVYIRRSGTEDLV
ncbi:ABC transporter permease [Yinghuangia sp. YIM S09857]|uniref:ABC transporter permease n=1 Tax=Yinghuangia sp. YIM S09857 TaxID=3436929 RepID=UPI003F52A1DA